MTNPYLEGVDLGRNEPDEQTQMAINAAACVALAYGEEFAAAVKGYDKRDGGVWAPTFVYQVDKEYALGRRAWDPWAALRNRTDVELRWDYLSGDNVGIARGGPGRWVITLDCRMPLAYENSVGHRVIRCTLAHELIHIERGIICAPGPIMEREEAIVDAEVARRLVPTDALIELLGESEEGLATADTQSIEKAFGVTAEVAAEAIGQLRDSYAEMALTTAAPDLASDFEQSAA